MSTEPFLLVVIQSGPSNKGSLLSAMDDRWTPLKQLVLYDEIIIIHRDGRAEPPDHRQRPGRSKSFLHRRKERYREPAMTTVKIQTRVILCDVDTRLYNLAGTITVVGVVFHK